MLVTFRSTATDSITMFGDVAQRLLKLMGASGKVPGALGPEDVPSALQQLESSIERLRIESHSTRTAAPPAVNEDWSAKDIGAQDDDEGKEPPVEISARAVPLIALLKRAAGANAEVMWEGDGK